MSSPSADDDRTVITSAPTSGAATGPRTRPAMALQDITALPLGTRLGEFELSEKIGEGGFSIVYLAWDHSLERKVALKEYMPVSIAARADGTRVNPRSERHRDTFEAGLRSFINEAKLLARFDHHSLVKVYRFWEAHGTAYMVMPFYEGVTLRDTVRALQHPPDEAWLMALLAPLSEALTVIHAEHCYHRDIAPDNVMLLAGSGSPLLLDFGAARRVIGDMTQALTIILKPGYAPVEQYAEIPGMRQGPWTDVYALAAVVYWLITGKTPPQSVGRMVCDSYVPLVECAADRYSRPFLQAIDRALVVLPEQRTQSIEALRHELGLDQGAADEADMARLADSEATVIRTAVPSRRGAVTPAPAPVAFTGPGVGTAAPGHAIGRDPRAGRMRTWLGAATLAAMAMAMGIWWALHKPVSSAPPATESVATAPAQGPASAPAPTPIESPATVPTPEAAPTATLAEPRSQSLVPDIKLPIANDNTAAPVATHIEPEPARLPKPERRAEAPVRSVQSPGNSSECARILQRLSLGETSPDLVERVKTLNCR